MNEAKHSPGQKALFNLALLLDTLSLDHPDIVADWLARIYAELTNASELLTACKATIKQFGFGIDAKKYTDQQVLWQIRGAIAKIERSQT